MGAGASTGADAGANASTGGATDGGTNGGEPSGLPDRGMPDGGIGDMNIPEQKPLQVPEVSSLLPLSQAAAANRPNVGGSSAGFNRIIEEEQGNRLNFVREALADADEVDRTVGDVSLPNALDLQKLEIGIVVKVLPR